MFKKPPPCWAGASFPFVSWFVYRDPLILLLSVIVGGLILWKHRGNMVRIVKGTESKFTLHKGSRSSSAKAGESAAAPEAAPSKEEAGSVSEAEPESEKTEGQ